MTSMFGPAPVWIGVATIEVSGRGGTWSRFDPASAGQPPAHPQPPILAAPRAIEPGPGT